MFADELKGGNAARKRAEETKARRQRLKAQQDQKKKAVAEAASFGTATPTTTNSFVSPSTAILSVPASFSALVAPKQVAASNELSAVERAHQERELRQRAALLKIAAVRIQASFRRHKETTTLHETIRQQLSGRLADLEMLRKIVKETKGVDYVAPPATARALCTQLVFLATFRSSNGLVRLDVAANRDLLRQFLEYAMIPGLQSSDAALDPLSTWLDVPEGRFRSNNLLRLCLIAINASAASYVVFDFLSALLVSDRAVDKTEEKEPLRRYCRMLLLAKQNSPTLVPTTCLPFAIRRTSLDLVSILRYHLMYVVAPTPIPEAAKELRDQCVSSENRQRASAFLLLVWNAINSIHGEAERMVLQVRFLVEIMTVPLLTWKVSSETVKTLVGDQQPTSTSPTIACIQALVEFHSDLLSVGKLNDLLLSHEVSLTVCPATSSQCLLANLIMMAHANPTMNGAQSIDPDTTTLYFNLLATLLDIVPLGSFSSRDSSVEWIDDGKGHHTPVVLSAVILDQCRLLFVDSFVRRLFQHAIGPDAFGAEKVLAHKDEDDLKHEADLLAEGGATSAATLAAKEARIDRNRGFWNSSKWAKRLTGGVSSLLSTTDGKCTSATEKFGECLVDTSSASRKLARGKGTQSSSEDTGTPSKKFNGFDKGIASGSISFLIALCRAYGTVLARWGGTGLDDLVSEKLGNRMAATSKPEIITQTLLNVLCFSTGILKASWVVIQSDQEISSNIQAIIDPAGTTPPTRSINARSEFLAKQRNRGNHGIADGAVLLYMFVSTLAHSLIVTDDTEIYDLERPLPLHQLRRFIQFAKKLLTRACCTDVRKGFAESNYFGLSLLMISSRALRDLYDRSSRRPMCIPMLWLVPDLLKKEIRQCKLYEDYVALLRLPVLRICPQLVSFKRRLKIFERIIVTNRTSIQGVNDGNPFNNNPLKPGIPVHITRGRLLEDGLATMNNLGSRMRHRISVQYVNAAGARETGVDAGGLFKEFWTDLCAIAFDLNYALFTVAEGSGCMYPNPSSGSAHGSDHIQLFEFVGRILGKALFESITIQPKFAHFFLSFLRGDYNYLHMLADLSTVDAQLYNNLMFLKTYDGDARDLCLSFTITTNDFGGNEEISLMPNGADVEVTNANKHRYIGLVAKHYVVDRVKEQSEAFTRGLWEVIDRSWLRIFNEPELQVLISGASDGKIDIDDLKAHTRYAGGYSGIDRNVMRFWSVIKSFGPREQAELLRFVTSCERPPPLGFATMNPPFTIQRVGIMRDGEKLPTASTCFNILKLPTYSSEKVLKDRLLYAIKSASGFELT